MEGPSSAQATLAHYWDDAPDALAGDQQLPVDVAEPSTSMLNTVLVGAAIIISVFWLGHWLNAWRRARRQRKFDLELRRRHGIPDSDTRPFNVAYQAASIAARDSARKSQSMQPENPQTHTFPNNTTPATATISEGFRPQGRSRPPIPHFPGQPLVRVPSGSFNFAHAQPTHVSSSVPDSSRAVSHLPKSAASGSWGPRYVADNYRATSVPAVPTVSSRSAFAVAAASGSLRSHNSLGTALHSSDRRLWQSSNRPTSISRAGIQPRPRKRLYLTADEEAGEEQTSVDKRSRTAGWGSDAMIDGDNEPTWAQSHPVEPQPASESREPQIGKSKGKRPADDAEGDLRVEGKRRHTKQRPKPSVQEKRGTKRERKEVDTASVLNDVMPVHKRGRAGDVDNDLSMVKEEDIEDEDDPTVSRNPLCGGRRIGQKWTSNGQEYMVGPNGDRLRLVSVKESRKKYYMPADSKHADNFHMVEVFVEKWLTEEQYARAKADGLLAWQENENIPTNIKQESPERMPLEGKENQKEDEGLGAISTTAITLSRARGANTIWNTPGQSPLTASNPHTNPFNNPLASAPQSPGPRRVKYSIGTVPAAALNASRIKSTWEKQEREANGLKMLRERMAAQNAAKTTPTPASLPTPVPSVPTLAPLATIPPPAITVTAASPAPTPKDSAPAIEKPTEPKPSFSFAPPAPKAVEPAPIAPAPAPVSAATTPNPFSFAAPKKDEPAKPLFSATPAPAAAPTLTLPPSTSVSASTGGFGTTPNATTATTPSPFGSLTTLAPVVSAPTTAPSPFGVSTTTAAPKPSPFALSAPTSQPAAPASSTAAVPSPFGTASTAPVPTTSLFGPTPTAPSPAATKPIGGFSFGATPAPTALSTSNTTPTSSTLLNGQAPKAAPTGFSFNTGSSSTNGTTDAKPANAGFSFSSTPAPTASTSTGFGTTSAATAPKPNVFGSTATPSTTNGFSFAASSNTGSGTTATPSPFSFGTSGASATSAATPAFGAPAAPGGFKFGATNTTNPIAAPSTAPSFKFGETNSAAPTGPAKPTLSIPPSNPFSSASTPTTTANANGGFTFGATAATPATPSKPVFNLGAASSPVMGTRQISTSRRVQRAMSKPPQ